MQYEPSCCRSRTGRPRCWRPWRFTTRPWGALVCVGYRKARVVGVDEHLPDAGRRAVVAIAALRARASQANRARNARPACPTIRARVLSEVLLVVALRVVEVGGWHDLGRDRPMPRPREHLLVCIPRGLRGLPLGLVVPQDQR